MTWQMYWPNWWKLWPYFNKTEEFESPNIIYYSNVFCFGPFQARWYS